MASHVRVSYHGHQQRQELLQRMHLIQPVVCFSKTMVALTSSMQVASVMCIWQLPSAFLSALPALSLASVAYLCHLHGVMSKYRQPDLQVFALTRCRHQRAQRSRLTKIAKAAELCLPTETFLHCLIG